MEQTHLAAEIADQFEALAGTSVCVVGHLGTLRRIGARLALVSLHDDSGQIQLLIRSPQSESEEVSALIKTGSSIAARGKVTRTRAGVVSLDVTRLTPIV